MTVSIDRAILLFEQHRFELAEEELAKGMARQPNHPVAHSLLALCLAQRKEFEAATEHAQQAVGFGPDMPFTHATLARVWLMRGFLDKATEAVAEAIRIDPSEPDHFVLEGHIAMVARKWQAARQAADRALSLDPEHIEALGLRAEALRRLGHAGPAVEQLLAALQVDPQNADIHAGLGWAYLEQDDWAKAMEHFREALRLDPELDTARAGVVETLKARNPVYRLFLKYIFLMQKLTSKGQWTVILVAWFGYIVARQLAAASPALAMILWPVIVGYLGFVLATWFAVPLANLALRLHPFGRLALSRDERIGSNFIGACLLAVIVAGVFYLVAGGTTTRDVAIYFGLMLLPLGATFQAARPWPRKPLIIYTIVLALLGVEWVGSGFFPKETIDSWPTAIRAIWELLVLPAGLFPLAAVVSLFAGNILMSVRWKQ